MNEKLENAVLDYENNNIFKAVIDNPMSQGIIGALNLIPGLADSAKAVAAELIKERQKKKLDIICNIIFEDCSVVSEMIKNVDTLYEFFKMIEVANKLTSNEKVVYLANLFKNSFISNSNCSLDEFEEYLLRLNDLSFREIGILKLLYDCEIEASKEFEGKEIDNDKYYSSIYNNLLILGTKEYNISQNELAAILRGTIRSGFCEDMVFTYLGQSKQLYCVTDYFINFVNKIIS
jgi:hypothetical protein